MIRIFKHSQYVRERSSNAKHFRTSRMHVGLVIVQIGKCLMDVRSFSWWVGRVPHVWLLETWVSAAARTLGTGPVPLSIGASQRPPGSVADVEHFNPLLCLD